MKKNMKKILAAGISASMVMMAAFPAFAGQWQQTEGSGSNQWWYEEDDGSYPANQWKEIESTWYHFNSDGYLDIGWKYISGKWYYMEDSGAMTAGTMYDGGYLNANGAWISTPVPPESYWVCSEKDEVYWTEKQVKYGLSGDMFVDNKDGSYTLTYTYDPAATVVPDLYNAIFVTAAFRFNGFSYSWQDTGESFIFTVTNVQDTY